MQNTKRRAVASVIICTFFMAGGSTLLKLAATSSPTHFIGILTHFPLYYALLVYATGAVFLVYGLRNGELSVLYPLIGLNFVWVAFTAMYFVGEQMNFWKWLGTGFILLGVAFMGQETWRARVKWKQQYGQS